MIEVVEESYLGLNRKESDGSYLCIPAYINKPIFFNETLYEIFSICNHKTIEEVKKYMINKYSDVPIERISSGVENALWYLRNIGIIKINGETIMKEQIDNEQFLMPDECDFQTISNLMLDIFENNKGLCYIDSNISFEKKSVVKEMCKVEMLRYGHTTGSHLIYKYSKMNSSDIDGVVIFNLHSTKRVAYIQSLIAKDIEIATEVLHNLKYTMNQNRVYNIKILFTGRKKEEDLVNFFTVFGFKKEAILKGESHFGDLHIYSLCEED